MSLPKKNLRICNKGHKYYKSSDCPVCPICEKERKPAADFLITLSAPARRALEREGIDTLVKLSEFTEQEILKLHGIGPSSIPILHNLLKKGGMSFFKK